MFVFIEKRLWSIEQQETFCLSDLKMTVIIFIMRECHGEEILLIDWLEGRISKTKKSILYSSVIMQWVKDVLKSQDVLKLGIKNSDRVAQNQLLKPRIFLPLRGTAIRLISLQVKLS